MKQHEFKKLFDDNFDKIRNYLFYRSGDKDLATDIVQDVFLKFWEKNLNYRPKENVGLLYKMASDLFVSKYRHSKVVENYKTEVQFKMNSSSTSPDEIMEYEQLKEKYEKTLNEMSEKQRVVFLMSRLEGLKYIEIAEQLGLSVKAVEKRMKNALGLLKLRLNYDG